MPVGQGDEAAGPCTARSNHLPKDSSPFDVAGQGVIDRLASGQVVQVRPQPSQKVTQRRYRTHALVVLVAKEPLQVGMAKARGHATGRRRGYRQVYGGSNAPRPVRRPP